MRAIWKPGEITTSGCGPGVDGVITVEDSVRPERAPGIDTVVEVVVAGPSSAGSPVTLASVPGIASTVNEPSLPPGGASTPGSTPGSPPHAAMVIRLAIAILVICTTGVLLDQLRQGR